jgi:hypothetical protein
LPIEARFGGLDFDFFGGLWGVDFSVCEAGFGCWEVFAMVSGGEVLLRHRRRALGTVLWLLKRSGMLALIVSLPSLAACVDGPRWVVEEQRGEATLYAEFRVASGEIWQQLDEVSGELESALGIVGSGERIEVVLFATQASYLRYLTERLPQARSRRAIFYRNGDVSQIYAWNNRQLMTDLRHEMVHVRVHQHLPFAPLWLDEGLAECFEERSGSRGDTVRRDLLRWKARLNQVGSLRGLEQLPSAEAMGADDYRNSWAWVEFFLGESEGTRRLLREYVAEIHKGEAPGAFSAYAESGSPGVLVRGNSYFRKMPSALIFRSSSK